MVLLLFKFNLIIFLVIKWWWISFFNCLVLWCFLEVEIGLVCMVFCNSCVFNCLVGVCFLFLIKCLIWLDKVLVLCKMVVIGLFNLWVMFVISCFNIVIFLCFINCWWVDFKDFNVFCSLSFVVILCCNWWLKWCRSKLVNRGSRLVLLCMILVNMLWLSFIILVWVRVIVVEKEGLLVINDILLIILFFLWCIILCCWLRLFCLYKVILFLVINYKKWLGLFFLVSKCCVE